MVTLAHIGELDDVYLPSAADWAHELCLPVRTTAHGTVPLPSVWDGDNHDERVARITARYPRLTPHEIIDILVLADITHAIGEDIHRLLGDAIGAARRRDIDECLAALAAASELETTATGTDRATARVARQILR